MLTNDLHRQLRSVVWTSGNVLDLSEGEHPIDDFAEYDVFAVQEIALGRRNEELAAIGVGSRIGLDSGAAVKTWSRRYRYDTHHRKEPWANVLLLKVLVLAAPVSKR